MKWFQRQHDPVDVVRQSATGYGRQDGQPEAPPPREGPTRGGRNRRRMTTAVRFVLCRREQRRHAGAASNPA